jgi:hypothetical protein
MVTPLQMLWDQRRPHDISAAGTVKFGFWDEYTATSRASILMRSLQYLGDQHRRLSFRIRQYHLIGLHKTYAMLTAISISMVDIATSKVRSGVIKCWRRKNHDERTR